MSDLNLFIANAGGTINPFEKSIRSAYDQATKIAKQKLNVNRVDVIVRDAAWAAIPELGVGGNTPSAHLIMLHLDPHHKIKHEDILSTLLHEYHHTMRWRKPGYGKTLEEVTIFEGLATAFEAEITGQLPIYAQVKTPKSVIDRFEKAKHEKKYDHAAWFFGTTKDIPRWFGYAHGYNLAEQAKQKTGKTAAELVNQPFSKNIKR